MDNDMNVTNICPICETGNLIETDYDESIIYKNATGHLSGFRCSTCKECEAVITDSKQAKHNKLAVVNFKRAVDGLMTTYQIRELIERLGISATEASTVIGGGPVSFHKYINGSVTQSIAIDSILRAINDNPEIYESLKKVNSERTHKISQPYKVFVRTGEESTRTQPQTHHAQTSKGSESFLSVQSAIFNIFRTV